MSNKVFTIDEQLLQLSQIIKKLLVLGLDEDAPEFRALAIKELIDAQKLLLESAVIMNKLSE